jgi:hypothetical protein
MPPEDNLQNQNSPAGAPPAPASRGGNGDNGRPSWLPEGFEKPEDFRAKYDEINSRYSEIQPKLSKWEKWGDPDEFERNLAARIAARDQQLKEQWERENKSRQPAVSSQADPFENFEVLTPREQGQKLAEHVARQVLDQMNGVINQRWTEASGRLGDMDNRFALLSRAMTEKLTNADLDLNKVWEEARALSTGDQNKLFDLAVERTLSPARLKKQIADAVAAERVKWEQEQANKNAAALVGSGAGATAASFRDTINARKNERGQGSESRKMRILERMIQYGSLSPAQV